MKSNKIEYDPTKNKTNPCLTKYERTKLIGNRAAQLANNAPPTIDIDPKQEFVPRKIAEEELKQGKMPFMIKRKLPDNTDEYWKLSDVDIL